MKSECDRMPGKILREAVKECLDNVEQFIKDADVLIINSSYGHAFALTVLAEEELVKAFICHICAEGILPLSYELWWRKRFTNHLIKQACAFGLALSCRLVELVQSIRKLIEEQVGEDFEKRRYLARQKLKEFGDNIRKQAISKRGEMYQFVQQFKTLQRDKEKGFYVDINFEDETLSSPKSVKKDEVVSYLNQVKSRLEFVKPFFVWSLTPTEKKLARAQLREALKFL